MKRAVIISLFGLLLICLLAGCSHDRMTLFSSATHMQSPSRYKQIAVVDFAGEGGAPIADTMTIKLLNAGFHIVERDRLKHLIYEQEMTEAGYQSLSDEEKARRLGQILNADAIITGRVSKLRAPIYYIKKLTPIPTPFRFKPRFRPQVTYENAQLEITGRAVDVRTGEVIWIGVVQVKLSAGKGDYLKLGDYISEPCAELVESFKNTNYIGYTLFLRDDEIEVHRRERLK